MFFQIRFVNVLFQCDTALGVLMITVRLLFFFTEKQIRPTSVCTDSRRNGSTSGNVTFLNNIITPDHCIKYYCVFFRRNRKCIYFFFFFNFIAFIKLAGNTNTNIHSIQIYRTEPSHRRLQTNRQIKTKPKPITPTETNKKVTLSLNVISQFLVVQGRSR